MMPCAPPAPDAPDLSPSPQRETSHRCIIGVAETYSRYGLSLAVMPPNSLSFRSRRTTRINQLGPFNNGFLNCQVAQIKARQLG
jgi:hypothetical protein